jgi:hypothetical protein
MAARNKPAGIRSLVYGIDKGKVRIEGLSVSACPKKWSRLGNLPGAGVGLDQAERERLFGSFLAIANP